MFAALAHGLFIKNEYRPQGLDWIRLLLSVDLVFFFSAVVLVIRANRVCFLEPNIYLGR